MDQQRETGVIVSFCPERKFGFIRNGTEIDVFFHVVSIRPDKIGRRLFYAQVGARVSFQRGLRHTKAEPQARDILPMNVPAIDFLKHREESVVTTITNGYCFLERSDKEHLYCPIPASLKSQIVAGTRISHGVRAGAGGTFRATDLKIILDIWPPIGCVRIA